MWEAVWTSSVLILAVAAVRLLFRRRMSQRARYALWAVVALRLLLPFPLAPSGFSVMNAVEAAGTAVRERIGTPETPEGAGAQGLDGGTAARETGGSPANGETGSSPADSETGGSPADGGPHPAAKAPANGTPGIPADGAGSAGAAGGDQAAGYPGGNAGGPSGAGLWKALWLSGAAAAAALLTVSNLRFSRRLKRRAVPVERERFPLPVYRAEGLSSPCLYGLLRPAVYLTPESLDPPRRLRHILAHEYTHYRHGDHLWSLVRCVCLALYWFDPLVWLAAELSRRDSELACDEGALDRLGEGERLDYGRTLVELISGRRSGLLCGATTMTSAGKSLKTRLELIVKKPRQTVFAVCAALLVVLAAAGCTFTGASPESAGPAPGPAEGTILEIDRENGTVVYGLPGEEPLALDAKDVPVVTDGGEPWTLSGLNLDDRIRVAFEEDGRPGRITWVANPLSMREEPDLNAEEARALVGDLYGERGVLKTALLEGGSRRERDVTAEEDAERYAELLQNYRWYRTNAPDMDAPDYQMELAGGNGERKLVFYGYREGDGPAVCVRTGDPEEWYCARRAVGTVPPSAAQALRDEFEGDAVSTGPAPGAGGQAGAGTAGRLTEEEASARFQELWDRGDDAKFQVVMADGTAYSHSVDSWYAAPGQLGALSSFYQWIPGDAPEVPEDREYTVSLSSQDGRAALTLYEGSSAALLERDGETEWYTLLPCQEEYLDLPAWRLSRAMFDSTVPYPVTEVSLPVKEGELYTDTARRFLQEVFEHWNDGRAPGDVDAIEDFIILETSLGDGSMVRADAFVFSGIYTLKPVDPEYTELRISSGKDDPDRPGWIRKNMQFRLEQEDGQWRCTSYGGGVGLD